MIIEENGNKYEVTEIEGKAWRDNDLYSVTCLICGKSKQTLARRPHQSIRDCTCKDT